MILTKTCATLAVLWCDRKKIITEGIENIKATAKRAQGAFNRAKPIILLFLLVALFVVVTARVKLDNDRIKETAAAEEMRLDLEKQEAIRASMIASEQAKAQEAAAAARQEREAVARVLYGTALHHSADAQKAVVWCIINRVESSLYPNTIAEVCSQPSQWMGYSAENYYLKPLRCCR